jgi:hypothetical protein
MMIYCTDSLLLKALCSNGYTQFSRLDSVPYTYHLLGSPIPRTTYLLDAGVLELEQHFVRL